MLETKKRYKFGSIVSIIENLGNIKNNNFIIR